MKKISELLKFLQENPNPTNNELRDVLMDTLVHLANVTNRVVQLGERNA